VGAGFCASTQPTATLYLILLTYLQQYDGVSNMIFRLFWEVQGTVNTDQH
jgi:hypothetical protein